MSVDIFLDKTIGEGHTLYEPIDEKSILNKKRYIIDALRKNAFIISIDNIQNIDAHSLEILKEILEHISNTIFILEYTIEQRQPTDILMAFYNDLNSFAVELAVFVQFPHFLCLRQRGRGLLPLDGPGYIL